MRSISIKKQFVNIVFLSLISIFLTQGNCIFAQRISLDLKSLDYRNFDFTPNESVKIKNTGENVIWVGKIDSIEIQKNDNSITLLFYCSHRYFDNV
ncbi:hypothetical protein ACFLSQ_05130 [Bacteroidota bacterium]